MATPDKPEVLWRSATKDGVQVRWEQHVLHFAPIDPKGPGRVHCVAWENGKVRDTGVFLQMRDLARKVLSDRQFRDQAKLAFEKSWYRGEVYEYLRLANLELTDGNAREVVHTALAQRNIRPDVRALAADYLLKEQRYAARRAAETHAASVRARKDAEKQYTLPFGGAAH